MSTKRRRNNIVAKVFLPIIFAPVLMYLTFLFICSVMRIESLYSSWDMAQSVANDFMAEHADRYFAFDLARYIGEQDPYFSDPANHGETFVKLLKKYPDMREEYLGALVAGIMSSRTKNYGRIQLLGVLEKCAGINFREGHDRAGGGYDGQKPYTQKGIKNVADWWTERLQKQAEAAIAATEDDYKFPPPRKR